MFTGIIEEIGTIRGIKRGNRSVVLEVQAKKVLEDLHVGDSIATNGVCLTVISFANGSFCADVCRRRCHVAIWENCTLGIG